MIVSYLAQALMPCPSLLDVFMQNNPVWASEIFCLYFNAKKLLKRSQYQRWQQHQWVLDPVYLLSSLSNHTTSCKDAWTLQHRQGLCSEGKEGELKTVKVKVLVHIYPYLRIYPSIYVCTAELRTGSLWRRVWWRGCTTGSPRCWCWAAASSSPRWTGSVDNIYIQLYLNI